MWRARREAIALAARCAQLARERGVSSSSSSHARWSFGKKSGKHRRGPPTTGALGGGSRTASQFEEEAYRLASGDGVVFFNGTPANEQQLTELVGIISSQTTDVTVLIKAHEETPLNKVTYVMDTCRRSGLNKIRLQAR